MSKIGFMQGRLTNKGGFFPQEFPDEAWEEEFFTAIEMGFQCMEWMFNFEKWENNPIIRKDGVVKIKELIKETGIFISGICANYFMKKNIFEEQSIEENINILQELIKNAEEINCKNIIIPMFEASEMQLDNVVLKKILKKISTKEVSILLETDCSMNSIESWIKELESHNIGVCYDIGNAAGLAKDTVNEAEDYANIIKNVHIKDKKKHGKTVMLGQGDAKIQETIERLLSKNYQGCFVLESYYGVEAKRDTKQNYNYVKDFF